MRDHQKTNQLKPHINPTVVPKQKGRMGLKSTQGGGEIIQVEGGHIIRAMGRKDRHSKVFTAKGPRDRRVRLAAHTAIQFYDVQDRLGFDRPSKAVDWLIKKAKASIDKLAELPPWDPTVGNNNVEGSTEAPVAVHTGSSSYQMHTSTVPQDVGDCMKSFFPTTSGEINHMSFQSYPDGLISRGSSQSQDLCLSLHTVQEPGTGTHSGHEEALYPGPGFDGGSTGWAQHHDMARFTRMMGWAHGGGGEGRGGIMFNPPPSVPQQAYLLQRGTLQSSFSTFLGPGVGHGSESFMGFCNPSQFQDQLHGGASMSNRASSSSLSPDGSSQH